MIKKCKNLDNPTLELMDLLITLGFEGEQSKRAAKIAGRTETFYIAGGIVNTTEAIIYYLSDAFLKCDITDEKREVIKKVIKKVEEFNADCNKKEEELIGDQDVCEKNR